MKKIIKAAAGIVFLIGIGLFLYPSVTKWFSNHMAEKEIDGFQKYSEEITDDNLTELYQAMQQYNEKIYEESQTGLLDQLAGQKSDFHLDKWGIQNNVVGYISIPKMEVELPLYLGATEENMTKGAVHLSQTSLPVGGSNTNTVIAAHRGYRGAPFFREIQLLEEGDEIYITNFWETLVYQVYETKIIFPDEVENIMIQEGKELLTLTTCHPYTKNYQRYLVYSRLIKHI